jgi:hypothetical protein
MTNIQQLLTQTVPSIRDIRELLNQTPILQAYALRDMEIKGIQGTDVRTYMKNQDNIISVLKRYEIDNASNAGMRVRGQIELAIQDGWAKIAGNDKAWDMFGNKGTGIIGALFGAGNQLLSSLSESPEFTQLLKNLELTFDNLGNVIEKLMPVVDGFIDKWAKKLGIDLGSEKTANTEVGRERALANYLNLPEVKHKLRQAWEKENASVYAGVAPDVKDNMFNQYHQELTGAALKNRALMEGVEGVNDLSELNWLGRGVQANALYNSLYRQARDKSGSSYLSVTPFDKNNISVYFRLNAFAGYRVDKSSVYDFASGYLSDMSRTNAGFPTGGSGSVDSDSTASMVTAMAGERRSLTINFNRELVNMPTNISATSVDNLEAQLRPMP